MSHKKAIKHLSYIAMLLMIMFITLTVGNVAGICSLIGYLIGREALEVFDFGRGAR